ncbi:MAG TPA: DUF4262 domain-containing protein [Planctomicrobium sp.]|nr:DUF4262 domain-containing protein [Planctomicrobium sp.]
MVRTKAEDDFDRKLLADIDSHGWHFVVIEEDATGPGYAFSVGMFHSFDHPEICLFGLKNAQAMGQIINGICELIKSGQRFDDWYESEDVLDNYACLFRSVDPYHFTEYFGYALWFYEGHHFSMLQCVWPDRAHRYPWNASFQPELIPSQPVLATNSDWPFLEAKNLGVFTTRQVIEEGRPVLMVNHDRDGNWQFLCQTTNDTHDGRIVCLQEIIESNPSVTELSDLPMGWQVVRNSPEMPWKRIKQESGGEEESS